MKKFLILFGQRFFSSNFIQSVHYSYKSFSLNDQSSKNLMYLFENCLAPFYRSMEGQKY